MTYLRFLGLSLLLLLGHASTCRAQPLDEPSSVAELCQQAIAKARPILRNGVRNYPSHRSCFSCHHQALPIFAWGAAIPAPREITASTEFPESTLEFDLAKQASRFTIDSFSPKNESMLRGEGVGGKSLTAAYGLWSLDIAGWPAEETTHAMVEYLLQNQSQEGTWGFQSFRPPAASSLAMSSAFTIYGILAYGDLHQDRQRISQALQRANRWFRESPVGATHEDRVGLAWGCFLLESSRRLWRDESVTTDGSIQLAIDDGMKGEDVIKSRLMQVMERQNEDGGWSQEDGMASDAYATGQAIVLWKTIHSRFKSSEIDHWEEIGLSKALRFLIDQQCEDGSWHVVSRSKPVQVYFDNGDPHGKDQFLSMMATSWSVAALSHQRTAALHSQHFEKWLEKLTTSGSASEIEDRTIEARFGEW